MNEIVNNYLLAGDKFTLEMHLKQPGFTYSACGPFTKSKERIQNFKETGYSRYVYQNKLQSWSKYFETFLVFCQIFLSPQVKRIAIIKNKHGMYELPHELPNDLTLRVLGNSEIFITSKKLLKNRN